MKLKLFTLAFLILITPLTSFSQESQFGNDELMVRERAMDYFWGRQMGDQDKLARAFNLQNGRMIYVVKGENGQELQVMSLNDFKNRLQRPIDAPSVGKILTLDIVDGQMAFVKLDIATGEHGYIDYLLMYKVNGNWSIVNKMFVRK